MNNTIVVVILPKTNWMLNRKEEPETLTIAAKLDPKEHSKLPRIFIGYQKEKNDL